MSTVYFISDLHLYHAGILEFQGFYRAAVMGVSTIEDHDNMLHKNIVDGTTKRDIIYILGDLGNHCVAYDLMKAVKGEIRLVLGNHDKHTHIPDYASLPNVTIYPPHKYKGYWITHIPIHPIELWGKKNIHGHVHSHNVKDEMYINVSVEATCGELIKFQDILSGKYTTHNRPF